MRVHPSYVLIALGVLRAAQVVAGPFAPAAGQPGSTAVANNSPTIAAWASGVAELARGPLDIANPPGGLASFGTGAEALGPATGVATQVVSLGDGGHITLTFAQPIFDGPGFDLAVFENGFSDTFLELAFVEVSSNGSDFLRFDAVSQTPTATQIGSFSALDPTNLDNLAGKYRAGFGTPFDLAQLAGRSLAVDVNHITFVRIVDVVGAILPAFGSLDSLGTLVNDPYPTAFASGGFDLDGVAALHVVPEPSTLILTACALVAAVLWRGRSDRRR
ncbi:MAG: hypothetical protein AB7O59_16260 [Pirellulales bacterium]